MKTNEELDRLGSLVLSAASGPQGMLDQVAKAYIDELNKLCMLPILTHTRTEKVRDLYRDTAVKITATMHAADWSALQLIATCMRDHAPDGNADYYSFKLSPTAGPESLDCGAHPNPSEAAEALRVEVAEITRHYLAMKSWPRGVVS